MKSTLWVLLALLAWQGRAQIILEGTVSDAAGNAPLEQVAVYLPELEKGVVTGPDGRYTIAGLPRGTYKIVASYIGYRTYSGKVSIDGEKQVLNIVLHPSAIEMEEVIVSTPFHKLQRENVMKVEHERVADLKARGSVTLSDGITRIPGVENVSTGMGIGKPVIRGLSSNRVLVYTQGIRLENQQFGDEHGLGLSDSGIESVEVIKGPASLLYGSDALGGVLYLTPEKFAIPGETEGDLNLNNFSNTLGWGGNAGIKSSSENWKVLARAAYASHADYKGGNGSRVFNSRFNEYDLKSGIGYQNNSVKSDLRYTYHRSNLGLPEGMEEQSTERTPVAPRQELSNHIISSSTDLFLGKSSLKLVLGGVFNDRKEFEEGDPEPELALHMKLSTLNYNLQYQLPGSDRMETIIGVQGMNQENKNFGEEVLIPDAVTNDMGVLATSHLHFPSSDLQLGVRYDLRAIRTDAHGDASETGYIAELSRNFNSFNAAAGYRADLSTALIARINLASGFRAPNLAELTSNGVHEGTNRYEIGNPDLSNEKNVQADLALEFNNEHLEVFLNGFYNAIADYIYIAPTGASLGEEEIFEYIQGDARLYGGEIGLHLHPHPLDWLHLESTFATVQGELKDGPPLPLIPANTLDNTFRVEFGLEGKGLQQLDAFIRLKSVFEQNRVSAFETPSDGYSLLDMGIGTTWLMGNQPLELRLVASNLLDKQYIAHLSRLKADGVPNIGRNIILGLKLPL